MQPYPGQPNPVCTFNPPYVVIIPATMVEPARTMSVYPPIPLVACGQHRKPVEAVGEVIARPWGDRMVIAREDADRIRAGQSDVPNGFHRHAFKPPGEEGFMFCSVCNRVPDGLLGPNLPLPFVQRDPGDEDMTPCA